MKSIFDPGMENELVERINSLTPESRALWGKMNVSQMVKHCSLCEDMYQGNIQVKRVFIGKLIGRLLLKQVLKDDRPFGKNSPTSRHLVAAPDAADLEAGKTGWIDRIRKYRDYHNPGFVHPFFGPLTKEQVGRLNYKHIDHHLRQFGA